MQLVFDRQLEDERARLGKYYDQFYRQFGRKAKGAWQIVYWKKKKEKDQWLDWYSQLNEEEGLNYLWKEISGISKDREIKVEYKEIEKGDRI